MMLILYTECLTWFLVSFIGYHFIKYIKHEDISRYTSFLLIFALVYLIMTKVIFGFVITFMLVFSITLLGVSKFQTSVKKVILLFAISILFCLPWLIYTYSLTGIPLYWESGGSNSLYTMSTPYSGELGDWKTDNQLRENPNHKAFMDSILKLTPGQMDIAYRNKAIQNIKYHPKKYFTNWIANIGRILFSYPYSHKNQLINTYFTIIPNMFLVVFIVLAIYLTVMNLRKIPLEIIILLMMFIIYLGGSTMVSGFRRIFYITIPFWFVFFAYIFNNVLIIKINKNKY